MSLESKKVIGNCAFCGDYEETRPYGPNEEEICCECALQNEESRKKCNEDMIFSFILEQTYQSLKGSFTDLFLKYLEEIVDKENNEQN